MDRVVPLVSIVTPTLNQCTFIEETIHSVIQQDYPRIEYLIMDGGSTDGTLDVLRRYGNRLRWVSESDEGQSAAINKGWRLTHGEIAAYLNSDDLYSPSAIHRVVEFFCAHPEVDVVYGDCDYIDDHARIISHYPVRPYTYFDLVRDAVNFIPQPATFVRRKSLEAVGFLDSRLHYAMDFDLWIRLGMKYQVAYIPERLAALRLHNGSKSIRSLAQFAPELIYIYQKLFSQLDLPQSVLDIKAISMSNVYYRASDCLFWTGDVQEALRHSLLALRCAPFNFRGPLVRALLGRLMPNIVSQWRNPYLLSPK